MTNDNQNEIYTLKQHIHTLHEALGAVSVAIEYVNASNSVSTWALRTTKRELETELYETQNELLALQNDE